MKKKLMVLMAMLTLVLSVGSPALAKSTAASVAATGRLAEIADHPFATHGIRDEASGAEYLLRSDTVDLYSYHGERITVYGTYASANTSSVSGDVSAGSKAADEPRLVDITRVEPALVIDDATPCVENLRSGEPNPDYDPDANECLTDPPVYCAAIGCKPGDSIVVTFELTIEGEVPEGSGFFLDDGRMDVAADAFCSDTCEEGSAYAVTRYLYPGNGISYEYYRADNSGSYEVFANGTRTFTEDETVSATYPDEGSGIGIQGFVTDISGTRVLVEENPNEEYGSAKAYVTVAEETRISDQRGQERVPATFDDLRIGQRVTVSYLGGVAAESYPEQAIASAIVILNEPPSGETVVATFELTVEGEPPAGTQFSASIGAAPDLYGMLLDEDGDGVYATSLPVARGAESEVRIWRLDSSNPNDPYAPLVSSTIKDFGTAQFDEDETFYATISFKDGNDGGKLLKNIAGGAKGLLPNTGGGETLAMLGAGALLIVGGLMLRKLVRR